MYIKKNYLEFWHLTSLLGLVLLTKLTVDMYLPILLSIKQALATNDIVLKLSLSLYMVGFAFSLIISAPLADRFGVKKIMVLSTISYLITALICAFAQNMTTIIIARFVQSMSGGSGTVLGRLEANRTYDKINQIKALSYFSTITSMASVILPFITTYLIEWFNWRAAFIGMAMIAVISLKLITKYIEDDSRQIVLQISMFKLGKIYKHLLTNKIFLTLSFVTMCTWCNYFIYLSATPFIYQEYLGLSSFYFALQLAITSLGYGLGTIIVRRLVDQYELEKMIWWSNALTLLLASILGLLVIIFPISSAILISMFSLIMFFVGIILPCCQSLILNIFTKHTSNTLALYFFLQFLSAGISSMIINFFSYDALVYLMVILTFLFSIAKLVLYHLVMWLPHTKQ